MRTEHFSSSVLGFILVLAGITAAPAGPGTGRHTYYTAYGDLVLSVPSDWLDVDPHDSHYVAQFQRADGQGIAHFSLIADPTDGFTLGQLESGFTVAKWGAQESAERGTLLTKKLSKPGNRGFFLSYNRKVADQNGFWYRAQGAVLISDLSFTFLADYSAGASDFTESIVGLLQSAGLKPLSEVPSEPVTQSTPTDSPDEGSTWKRIPLEGHGGIEFLAPRVWRVEARRSREDLPPTVELRPSHGDSFSILITVFWSVTGDPNYNVPAQVLKSVEAQRDRVKGTATESELHIKEFQGEKVAGYYFQATDRHPHPGEWPYVTQGAAALEDLLLGFTVLSREANQPEASVTLDMLKRARKSPR